MRVLFFLGECYIEGTVVEEPVSSVDKPEERRGGKRLIQGLWTAGVLRYETCPQGAE
jgi:hypothetical protein